MMEKPLIERYRILIGLMWAQTDNLDRAANSVGVLLRFIPTAFSTRRRLLKKEAHEHVQAIIEANVVIRQALTELGISAQEET